MAGTGGAEITGPMIVTGTVTEDTAVMAAEISSGLAAESGMHMLKRSVTALSE